MNIIERKKVRKFSEKREFIIIIKDYGKFFVRSFPAKIKQRFSLLNGTKIERRHTSMDVINTFSSSSSSSVSNENQLSLIIFVFLFIINLEFSVDDDDVVVVFFSLKKDWNLIIPLLLLLLFVDLSMFLFHFIPWLIPVSIITFFFRGKNEEKNFIFIYNVYHRRQGERRKTK